MKKIVTITLALCMVATMMIGCNSSKSNEDNNSNSDNSNVSNVSMGNFVQTDITPENSDGSSRISTMNQNSDGEILLNIQADKENVAIAFTYSNGEWIKKDNTLLKDFANKNKSETIRAILDFDNNWWVAIKDDSGELKIHIIAEDGNTTEIEVPSLQASAKNGDNTYVSAFGVDENGTILICVPNTQQMTQEYFIFDSHSKTLVNTIQPTFFDADPVLSGDTVYAFEKSTNKLYGFDIKTGESESSTMPESFSTISYNVDNNSEITFATATGIHQTTLNSNTAQTIIDNQGFAYADPQVNFFNLLFDNENDIYYLACMKEDGLEVYKYHFDENLPTTSINKLHVWAMEDNSVVRGIAAVFSQDYPECEVVLEFGKSSDTSGLTHDDIVRNINTRLLAGDAPDILFIDGLSYQTLMNNSLLSEINVDINKDDFYENIISSYEVDGKIYAYPAFFKFPAIVGETKSNFQETNTLKGISEIYKDTNTIFNDSYQDVFETFFTAEYSSLFPDYKTVDEEKLMDFLTYTNSIIDSQNITSEVTKLGTVTISSGVSSIDNVIKPSFSKFNSNKTNHGTGIIYGINDGFSFFRRDEEIGIEPLGTGDYSCSDIATIPANAKNKDMAVNFIDILLNDDNIPPLGIMRGLTVNKAFDVNSFKTVEIPPEMAHITKAFAFDWEGLMSKLNKPMDSDKTIHDVVYEQAKKLYEDEIDVDTAHAEIMKILNILLAERQ